MKTTPYCLLACLFLYTACQTEQQHKFTLPPVEVTLLKIEPKTIPAIFEYVGFAESSHPVEIRARVEGYLKEINFTEGDFVKEGDLLFVIDPASFEAELDNAKGELKRVEANLWEAQRTAARLKPLYEKKAASQRDLDTALAAENAANATVDSAKARVRSAEINLGHTKIHSPVSGLSSLTSYQEGSLITPGPSALLTTISVLNPIWVKYSVTSNEVLKYHNEVKAGRMKFPEDKYLEVEIVLADGSVFPNRGVVDYAAPTYDQKTGTMIARATIPNPSDRGYDWQLKPGQFVRIRVFGAIRPNAILVPQKSVQHGQDGLYVIVVDDTGKAEVRSIEAGEWYDDDWIIKGGLKAGEQVVVDGVNKVVAGQQVIAKPYKRESP
jgi:membrane fusion protein (multidrug efflux system)